MKCLAYAFLFIGQTKEGLRFVFRILRFVAITNNHKSCLVSCDLLDTLYGISNVLMTNDKILLFCGAMYKLMDQSQWWSLYIFLVRAKTWFIFWRGWKLVWEKIIRSGHFDFEYHKNIKRSIYKWSLKTIRIHSNHNQTTYEFTKNIKYMITICS